MHFTYVKRLFSTLDKSMKTKVKIGNGDMLQAVGKGDIEVKNEKGTMLIKNVLYIPDLAHNLLSVAQLMQNGYFWFSKKKVVFFMMCIEI